MKTSKFQFLNPYLVEVYFDTNTDFLSETDFINVEMQNAFSIQVKRIENKKRANVSLMLETNKDNKNAPFNLRIKVASDFRWEDGLDEEMIEVMLNNNAPALLLGYMRPIVASITNSSKFPAYNLPFINFNE